MKRAGKIGLATVLAATVLAAPAKAQDDAFVLPPWTGAYEPQDEDERGFWQTVDELEDKLKHSKEIVRNEALDRYIRGVLCETVGDDRCAAARIYVLRDHDFNAGMYPNGMMIVNTGLLLRMRNEAELASVLGHEFGHFEKRHAVDLFKTARSGSDFAAWTTVLIGAPIASLFYSNVFQHSRDMETDADFVSHGYLARSRYPSRASSEIWLRLIDEDDRRAEERKRRKRNRNTSWLATHPAPLKRADYLAKASAAANDQGDYATQAYRDAMRDHLLSFFDDQLQRNDFAASKYLLEQLAGDDWQADHRIMQGELFRKRGHERDLTSAEQAYRAALDLGTDRPEVWRGMGLVMLKQGRRDEAVEALRTYLERAPDASDAAMITMMIGG